MNTNASQMASDVFSIHRLYLVIRINVLSQYRSWLVSSAALLGLLLISAIFNSGESDKFYINWFYSALFLIGIYLSAGAFKDLHDKTRNHAYLLIPASSLEKTLAQLLIVTIGFIIYLLAFMTIAAFLVEIVKTVASINNNPVFNLFSADAWIAIPGYLFIQSFYFLGAAWFRKTHLAKTTLVLGAFIIALAIFSILIVRLFFENSISIDFDFTGPQFQTQIESLEILIKTLFIIVPISCWTITWFRVRETQVSDGV